MTYYSVRTEKCVDVHYCLQDVIFLIYFPGKWVYSSVGYPASTGYGGTPPSTEMAGERYMTRVRSSGG